MGDTDSTVACAIRVEEGDGALATADVTALQEILLNLLGNAVRHGEGKPIDVTVGSQDGVVEVRVRDWGAGVPPSERDRIFDPYERGAHRSPRQRPKPAWSSP